MSAALQQQAAEFFAAFKAERGMVGPRRPMPRREPAPFDLDAARAELARLEAQHDPHFQYSDDHTVWRRGTDEACRMRDLRAAIADHERKEAA